MLMRNLMYVSGTGEVADLVHIYVFGDYLKVCKSIIVKKLEFCTRKNYQTNFYRQFSSSSKTEV